MKGILKGLENISHSSSLCLPIKYNFYVSSSPKPNESIVKNVELHFSNCLRLLLLSSSHFGVFMLCSVCVSKHIWENVFVIKKNVEPRLTFSYQKMWNERWLHVTLSLLYLSFPHFYHFRYGNSAWKIRTRSVWVFCEFWLFCYLWWPLLFCVSRCNDCELCMLRKSRELSNTRRGSCRLQSRVANWCHQDDNRDLRAYAKLFRAAETPTLINADWMWWMLLHIFTHFFSQGCCDGEKIAIARRSLTLMRKQNK